MLDSTITQETKSLSSTHPCCFRLLVLTGNPSTHTHTHTLFLSHTHTKTHTTSDNQGKTRETWGTGARELKPSLCGYVTEVKSAVWSTLVSFAHYVKENTEDKSRGSVRLLWAESIRKIGKSSEERKRVRREGTKISAVVILSHPRISRLVDSYRLDL